VLHDSPQADPVVDSDAALEFMKEATKLATVTQLSDIGERLERKSDTFRAALSADRAPRLDEAEFRKLVGAIFSLRRKAGRLLKRNEFSDLRDEIAELLHGEPPLPDRFDRFVERVEGFEPGMVVALASELLHFSDPQRYWLWTYWIWNPDSGRGALPLVIQDEIDLGAGTPGAIYQRVGEATARINAHGHAVGYASSGRGLFGTDVFLACVYSVYMYTMFRVKLSQEFNRILPELPELVQRVLGVHRAGESDGS
jgi:hypothetical protein